MNKQYIFFTTGIKDLGGVELYLLNKCSWLIENKWDVHIFSATYTKEKYKLESLEKYRNEVIPIMEYTPYECSTKVVKKTKFLNMVLWLFDYDDAEDNTKRAEKRELKRDRKTENSLPISFFTTHYRNRIFCDRARLSDHTGRTVHNLGKRRQILANDRIRYRLCCHQHDFFQRLCLQ